MVYSHDGPAFVTGQWREDVLRNKFYETEHGKEFTQKLLDLQPQKMTEKYLDSRKKEFMLL
ncbi:hypothetical protein BSPA111_04170 [Buttiauxella sp. A111]|nr:hypothetical protein BSPA111_04170 [Buttiauxella sp. A111]